MKRILILIIGLIGVAYGQSAPTSAKTRFVNGLYLGTKLDAYFNAADSNAIYWRADSSLMAKYKGTARALAFAVSGGYLPISDTLTMLSGYKTYYPRTAISAGTGISYNAATGVITNSSPSSGGTVTSVATNTGSGITGGTITSTGTIAADTTILSTKANVTGALVGYTTTGRFLDSLTNVQARIQTKQPLGAYITLADSSTILAGRWLPNRSADSIAVIRALANTKQPIGNYITFADSTTILAGRWLPNRSADSTAVLRALINTKGTGNGTVTSIATNTGTGITGGTITSTGTLAIDTATILSTKANVTGTLVGYTTTGRFLDSLTNVQSRIQTKQPLGNYLTFADSSTILAGRWLPNRSADSIAVVRALANTKGTGTVTSVAASAGTGISVSGSPITTSGTLTITNTAPDQTVTLTAGTGISVSGTYPNFTVTNSSPSSGGTVTSVATNNGTGITGGTITSTGTIAADTTILSTKANVTASLLGYTATGGFLDSLTNVQSRIQTKQPLGAYITLADSSTILAGRWLPNRSKDSIAVIRALANTKLNISDTAAMLTNRLKVSDTLTMLSNYRRKTTKITNSDLANSTISGISLGSNLASLTNGYGISGSAYNGSTGYTWLVDTSAISTKANVTGLLTGYATTSALSGYVDLTTNQTVGGAKTFTSILTSNNTISSTNGTVNTILSYGTGIGSVGTNSNHPLVFLANASEMARLVQGTGAFSVGGVGAPQGTLHVGNANSAVVVNESSSIPQIMGTNRAGTASAGLFLKGFPLTMTGNGGGGAEGMRLTSSNNLLIKTTTESPNNEALQVAGSGLFSSSVTASSLNLSGRGTGFIYGMPDWRIYNTSGNGLVINNYTVDALAFSSTGAATFSSSVTANGGVIAKGITNDNTAFALDATNSSGSSLFKVRNDGAAIYSSLTGSGIRVVTSSSAGQLAATLLYTTTETASTLAQRDGSGALTATGFVVSSDLRFKDIITQDGDLYQYTLKADEEKKIHYGYIAQEVEKTLPFAVTTNSEGYKAINYIEVHAIKIRELEKQIEELKKLIKK